VSIAWRGTFWIFNPLSVTLITLQVFKAEAFPPYNTHTLSRSSISLFLIIEPYLKSLVKPPIALRIPQIIEISFWEKSLFQSLLARSEIQDSS